MSQFNTNPSYLSSRLFVPDRPRIGANTFLNVNVLPDFVEYIKKNLTSKELVLLSEYQLQTYIMELSIKQRITDTLDQLIYKVISYIRDRKEFWINGRIFQNKENEEMQKQQEKHQHEAIVQYKKDIQLISSKIPLYPEKIFNLLRKPKIHPFLQSSTTQFFDKDDEVLKLNLANYSMMPAYVFEQYIKSQQNVSSLPKYDSLSQMQKKTLNVLQNVVEYLLMQQKSKKSNNNFVKRRQFLMRNRKKPSYFKDDNNKVKESERIEEQCDDSQYSKEIMGIQENNKKNILEKDNKAFELKNPYQNQASSSSSQQENEFYHSFHRTVSKKQFYDSRMFNKEASINLSHNIMEILRCLLFFQNGKESVWFQKRWKEQEEQKIVKQQRRRSEQRKELQQQQEEHQVQQSQGEQDQLIERQKGENNPIIEQKNEPAIQQNGKKQPIDIDDIGVSELKSNPDIAENKDQQQQSNFNIESLEEIIEIGIPKPIFDELWKNPHSFSFKKLSTNLSQKILSMRQIYFITKQFALRRIDERFNHYKSLNLQQQRQSINIQQALVNPQTSLQDVFLEFKEMIQHPENVKLSAFKTEGIKIPWEQTDYLLFLKGLLEYFFIPTNNKKIAQFMMLKSQKKNIEATHVKYIKGIYLKNMQIRIDRGESGGGKKGRMLGKLEFIEKDIEFFSMRWFDKIKKLKRKNRRRRFEDDDEAGQQLDSAY